MQKQDKAMLDEQARAAQRAYHREWRARNKQRTKEINARYWRKRAERLQQQKEVSK